MDERMFCFSYAERMKRAILIDFANFESRLHAHGIAQ
jgi:hypothetical protein